MSVLDEMGGSVKKSRTHLAITNQPKNEQSLKHSSFLITINPNLVQPSPKSPGFQDMVKRLTTLGDFILEDKNLIRILKFNNDSSIADNVKKIAQVDKDRIASVEYGAHTHKLHLHISFFIKHKTKLMVDRAKIENIASTLLGVDKKILHINIQVSGVPSFEEYVKKNIPKIV